MNFVEFRRKVILLFSLGGAVMTGRIYLLESESILIAMCEAPTDSKKAFAKVACQTLQSLCLRVG